MSLFALIPYFWLALMVLAVLATIVAAIRARPKKAPKQSAAEAPLDTLASPEPLDFGDELTQMEGR
ncbi:MAG: hypothetical protein KGQ60_02125 [Planctomycetes bacterium]|nr:hypothetical protein [Planctomycetota bacterium]